MISGMMSDGAGCETQCAGAADLMGDYMFAALQAQWLSTASSGGERLLSTRSFAPLAFQGLTRRLTGHGGGVNLKARAMIMDVLCSNVDLVTCAMSGGAVACGGMDNEDEDEDDPLSPEVLLPLCAAPLAVAVSVELSVSDPQGFVNNPASKEAVEAGIADAANVAADAVEAVLTVARRLEEEPRHLQGTGTVNVDATIHVADAATVATLKDSVNSIETAEMATSLNTALSGAGINPVAVAVLDAVTAPTPTARAVARADATDPEGGGGGGDTTANGAFEATCGPFVLAILIAAM